MLWSMLQALIERLRGGLFTGGTWREYGWDRSYGWLAPLERVRPWAWAWVMGFVIGYRCGLTGWALLVCAAGVWAGELSGWGNAMGRAVDGHTTKPPSWWQIPSNHWMALLLRGAMWGAVPALFVWLLNQVPGVQPVMVPWQLIPIMAASMWGGAQLGRLFDIERGNPWGSAEWYRGCLIGALIYGIG